MIATNPIDGWPRAGMAISPGVTRPGLSASRLLRPEVDAGTPMWRGQGELDAATTPNWRR